MTHLNTILLIILTALFSCGDDAQLQDSETKGVRSQDARGDQNQASQQIVVNQNQTQQPQSGQENNLNNASFGDNRYDSIGKKAGSTEAVEEKDDTPPGLAAGTILETWQYNKSSRSKGYDRCPNHARKNECASKRTKFVRGVSPTFGNNVCECE